MTLPFAAPLRLDVPPEVEAWAREWALINVDLAEESLILSHGHRRNGLPSINLYGGNAPIEPHIDIRPEDLDGGPPYPVWGLLLACPPAMLAWEGGCVPVSTGYAYMLDPMHSHWVACEPGGIAFAGTFEYDPRERFGTLERFARNALEIACDLHRSCPDPLRFAEREAGYRQGELD